MTDRNSETTHKKSIYYNDDQLYSTEHKKDLDNFQRLLERMKETEKGASDKKAAIGLNDTLNSFKEYLAKNRLVLTANEKKEIIAITGSGMTNPVIKRMVEDVIHKVKRRLEYQTAEEEENKKIKKEIQRLHSSPGGIIGWFNLLKFALAYGTITPFTHRLKYTSFSILRENAYLWQSILHKYIESILDNDYYILSTIEYNTLKLITELKTPIEKIKNIPFENSYDPDSIALQVDKFTEIYCCLKKNYIKAEEGLKHAFKRTPPPHGVLGNFRYLISVPLHNNKPKNLTDYEKTAKTIEGALFSFYTSRQKMPVTTLNQLIYLTGTDTEISTNKKNLTPAAIEHEKNTRQKENSQNTQIIKRYDELDRILNTYLKKGYELEEKILQQEAGSNYKHWQTEHMRKPFLRIKRIIDGYIKYFLEPAKSEKAFIPLFQGTEYPGYIQRFSSLLNSISGFTLFDLDLVGKKDKEFISVKLPEESDTKEFLNYITQKDLLPNVHEHSLISAKSMLSNIANKSYDIALRFNEIITAYINRREIINSEPQENYDFFTTAVLANNSAVKCRFLARDDEIYLNDFFESACAMAFNIAAKLNHQGIEAMQKDFETVKSSRDEINNINESLSKNADIDNKYIDSITGLLKEEYINDHVLPKLYDDSFNYSSETIRTVFFTQINGIKNYNQKNGYEKGDILLKTISEVFQNKISEISFSSEDILIKKEGPAIIGFLNGIDFTSVVELLQGIQKQVQYLTDEITSSGVSINTGLYKEKTGTNFTTNIENACMIMNMGMKKGPGHIAFLRNSDSTISEKDFNRYGEINPELVTIL